MLDMIEIRFDIINPIQPECGDPVQVKQQYGDKIALHGTIGIQTTLPFGMVAVVRQEIIDRIEKCGYNGGLILGPANDIMYDTLVENIVNQEVYNHDGMIAESTRLPREEGKGV